MFQQRHFEAIADALNELLRRRGVMLNRDDLVSLFGRLFLADNPRFKPQRFYARVFKGTTDDVQSDLNPENGHEIRL